MGIINIYFLEGGANVDFFEKTAFITSGMTWVSIKTDYLRNSNWFDAIILGPN